VGGVQVQGRVGLDVLKAGQAAHGAEQPRVGRGARRLENELAGPAEVLFHVRVGAAQAEEPLKHVHLLLGAVALHEAGFGAQADDPLARLCLHLLAFPVEGDDGAVEVGGGDPRDGRHEATPLEGLEPRFAVATTMRTASDHLGCAFSVRLKRVSPSADVPTPAPSGFLGQEC